MAAPFSKNALVENQSWSMEANDEIKADDEKIVMETVIIMNHKDENFDSSTCIVYNSPADDNNPARLRLLCDSFHEDLVDTQMSELSRVAPIRSHSGMIYFVERDKSTQDSHVVELTISFDQLNG